MSQRDGLKREGKKVEEKKEKQNSCRVNFSGFEVSRRERERGRERKTGVEGGTELGAGCTKPLKVNKKLAAPNSFHVFFKRLQNISVKEK